MDGSPYISKQSLTDLGIPIINASDVKYKLSRLLKGDNSARRKISERYVAGMSQV
ncbi:MAG: hypothetical protein ABIG93_05480 [archaeon]